MNKEVIELYLRDYLKKGFFKVSLLILMPLEVKHTVSHLKGRTRSLKHKVGMASLLHCSAIS